MLRSLEKLRWVLVGFCGLGLAGARVARAGLLTTESLYLNVSPGSTSDNPYEDEVFNTSPNLSTWGEKGAIGLEGSSSIYPSGATYVNNPASILALKFPVGSIIDSLNSTYGAGNWTISNPAITFQYTYYANNAVFGAARGLLKRTGSPTTTGPTAMADRPGRRSGLSPTHPAWIRFTPRVPPRWRRGLGERIRLRIWARRISTGLARRAVRCWPGRRLITRTTPRGRRIRPA